MVAALWVIAMSEVAFAHRGIHERQATLDRTIERAPERADLYLERAELHRLHGDLDAARADCERARAHDPELNRVRLVRAFVERDAGRLARALALFDEFLSHESEHVRGRIERARVLVALSRHDEAAAEYTRAIGTLFAHGQVPRPEYYLERARAQVAVAAEEDAIRGLDEGLARLGRPVSLAVQAIELETRIGRHDDALARIEPYVRCARGHHRASWLARRGDILHAAGRIEAARIALERARSALQELPASRRQTRAATRLRTRIDQLLEELPPSSPRDVAAPRTEPRFPVFALVEAVAFTPAAWLRALPEFSRSAFAHPCPS